MEDTPYLSDQWIASYEQNEDVNAFQNLGETVLLPKNLGFALRKRAGAKDPELSSLVDAITEHEEKARLELYGLNSEIAELLDYDKPYTYAIIEELIPTNGKKRFTTAAVAPKSAPQPVIGDEQPFEEDNSFGSDVQEGVQESFEEPSPSQTIDSELGAGEIQDEIVHEEHVVLEESAEAFETPVAGASQLEVSIEAEESIVEQAPPQKQSETTDLEDDATISIPSEQVFEQKYEESLEHQFDHTRGQFHETEWMKVDFKKHDVVLPFRDKGLVGFVEIISHIIKQYFTPQTRFQVLKRVNGVFEYFDGNGFSEESNLKIKIKEHSKLLTEFIYKEKVIYIKDNAIRENFTAFYGMEDIDQIKDLLIVGIIENKHYAGLLIIGRSIEDGPLSLNTLKEMQSLANLD